MIPLTRRQLSAVTQAAKDRLSLASACDYVLTIGGKDYTRFVDELKTPDQDGPAVVLEGKVLAYLPETLEHEECRVEHVVGGERITSYLGEVDRIEARGYYSTFLAATPSRYARDTLLGDGPEDDLDYVDAEPSDALYEVASRLDYGGVEIPRVPRPLFTRAGDDAFRWTDAISEVYEAIRGATALDEALGESTGLVLEDTPLGAAVGRVKGSVFGDEAPAWVFEEGLDFGYGDLSVESRREGRYGKVVVWRALPDDTHENLAEAEVDNGRKKVRKNAVLAVEHSGDKESAHEQALRVA